MEDEDDAPPRDAEDKDIAYAGGKVDLFAGDARRIAYYQRHPRGTAAGRAGRTTFMGRPTARLGQRTWPQPMEMEAVRGMETTRSSRQRGAAGPPTRDDALPLHAPETCSTRCDFPPVVPTNCAHTSGAPPRPSSEQTAVCSRPATIQHLQQEIPATAHGTKAPQYADASSAARARPRPWTT